MIALDTSSLRRYLAGAAGKDVDAVATSLEHHTAALPPVVLTEILSEPRMQPALIDALTSLPLLEIRHGYWQRAGQIRANVIAAGQKARVADALIAQICIDHEVALITHDRDFRHYVRYGLVLA